MSATEDAVPPARRSAPSTPAAVATGAASGALLALAAVELAPLAAPRVLAWAPAAGALLGAIVAALAAAARRPRPAPAPEAAWARDPGLARGPLHVVASARPADTLRALLVLAAPALLAGGRVLIVDASPRLRLHARLGRDARWGLRECLLADLPVLGLVQYAGAPGLYLLAHGDPARSVRWSSLGRKLDEVLPHFARVLVAADPRAPHALGDALRGRVIEGWWSGRAARLPRAALELIGRLGIALFNMDLSGRPEVTLEAIAGRLSHRAPTFRTLAAEPLRRAARAAVGPEAKPPDPVVLDCDLQVRERLRFLAWVRRVQAERRHVEAPSAS